MVRTYLLQHRYHLLAALRGAYCGDPSMKYTCPCSGAQEMKKRGSNYVFAHSQGSHFASWSKFSWIPQVCRIGYQGLSGGCVEYVRPQRYVESWPVRILSLQDGNPDHPRQGIYK